MPPNLFPSINLVAGDSAMHSTLSRGESIGLAFDTEAGLFSITAAFTIFILILRRISQERNAMDIYIISLFAAEFIQGLGHGFSMKWVIEGEVYTSTFCTAQGLLQQFGEVGVALATLAIAMQTFWTIWRLRDPNMRIASVVVGLQWILIILFVATGFGMNTRPPEKYYATPTPYWCWIAEKFENERIYEEYLWLWLALAVSIALYIPLFLLGWGCIRVPPPDIHARWYTPRRAADNRAAGDNQSIIHDQTKSRKLMCALMYPIVYCVTILPLSIVRWIYFSKSRIPPVPTFIFGILFSLSGVLNAVLYARTRPILPRNADTPQAP